MCQDKAINTKDTTYYKAGNLAIGLTAKIVVIELRSWLFQCSDFLEYTYY